MGWHGWLERHPEWRLALRATPRAAPLGTARHQLKRDVSPASWRRDGLHGEFIKRGPWEHTLGFNEQEQWCGWKFDEKDYDIKRGTMGYPALGQTYETNSCGYIIVTWDSDRIVLKFWPMMDPIPVCHGQATWESILGMVGFLITGILALFVVGYRSPFIGQQPL